AVLPCRPVGRSPGRQPLPGDGCSSRRGRGRHTGPDLAM
ncbi:MAG: hypothetical protein AVDCRST_MAG36-1733, partial [uncultured Nocardioidaceae bacterium]